MIFALYLAFTASRKRRPAANGWGGLRPEICENLGGKSEKIIDFGLRKDAEGAKICEKLLFLHRYGIEQSARFQADIHFAVRICHGRVFLTGTTGGGCRQWNDDG